MQVRSDFKVVLKSLDMEFYENIRQISVVQMVSEKCFFSYQCIWLFFLVKKTETEGTTEDGPPQKKHENHLGETAIPNTFS